jgi:large subunit ribosomal protein L18
MVNKEISRIRRSRKTRAKIAELHKTRLTVYKSNTNIYAQVIDGATNKVLASASTLEADVKKNLKKPVMLQLQLKLERELQKRQLKLV